MGVQHTYILRMGGKSIRTRRLDRNDGAARRVAHEKGPDPKPLNESCRQVSPSQVRDAFGPHDGNEHTPRAIASDGVHSTQQCGPAGLVCSFRPNVPLHRCQGLPNEVCTGLISKDRTVAGSSRPYFASRSKIKNLGVDPNGNASRNCWMIQPLVGCLVT